MNENDIIYLILLVCLCAVAYQGGKSIGIRTTIDYLEEQGMISFEDDEK